MGTPHTLILESKPEHCGGFRGVHINRLSRDDRLYFWIYFLQKKTEVEKDILSCCSSSGFERGATPDGFTILEASCQHGAS